MYRKSTLITENVGFEVKRDRVDEVIKLFGPYKKYVTNDNDTHSTILIGEEVKIRESNEIENGKMMLK